MKRTKAQGSGVSKFCRARRHDSHHREGGYSHSIACLRANKKPPTSPKIERHVTMTLADGSHGPGRTTDASRLPSLNIATMTNAPFCFVVSGPTAGVGPATMNEELISTRPS